MFVKEMQIKEFRQLRDIHLGPFASPQAQSDVIALAGPNGGGKSSVLELLAIALSSTWNLSYYSMRSNQNSSFEVTLAASKAEIEAARGIAASNPALYAAAMDHLDAGGEIHRSFNFPGGKYDLNPGLQNTVFSLVQQATQATSERSFGFFLRADRFYANRSFQRELIFNYAQTRHRSHARSLAYTTPDQQYADMHDFLVQQRYHYFSELGAYEHRRALGESPLGERPSDPLQPYDQLLGRLFPGYSLSDQGGEIPSMLMLDHPGGFSLPFNDLSSGEKEVFFILSFFLRHDVADAVILIDEPELHLHPELARRLLRLMTAIRPNNQIWCATHNTEIIDEAGRDRTYFLARDSTTNYAGATAAADEAASSEVLRDFFGFSGYLGVARTMVFLEGLDSSADRKVLSALFSTEHDTIKFIPAGGVESQQRLNAAILSILDATFSYMNFYLIRDRDYLTDEMIDKYRAHSSGRVHVLKRNHIENYLLVPEAISKILEDIYSKTVSPSVVEQLLKEAAVRIASEVAANMAGFRLNLSLRPQDFSLDGRMRGKVLTSADGTAVDEAVQTITTAFLERSAAIEAELSSSISGAAVDELTKQCITAVVDALGDGSWISKFPGKRLLHEVCAQLGLGNRVVFVNSIIKQLGAQPDLVDDELHEIMAKMAANEPLV